MFINASSHPSALFATRLLNLMGFEVALLGDRTRYVAGLGPAHRRTLAIDALPVVTDLVTAHAGRSEPIVVFSRDVACSEEALLRGMSAVEVTNRAGESMEAVRPHDEVFIEAE